MMILKENHNIATFKRAKKYKLSRDSMDKESMDYANWNDIGLYAICFIYNAHVWLDYHWNGTWRLQKSRISSLVSLNSSHVQADILTIGFLEGFGCQRPR